jgi:hypothetical protein
MADMGIDRRQIKELLASENLQIEFKSDLKCPSDHDLIAAVVALATTEEHPEEAARQTAQGRES